MSEPRHPLVSLAMEAIRIFVCEQWVIEPSTVLSDPFPISAPSAGVFVCLKRGGELRGCIGTTEPTKATLAEEVISNAVAAATRDPRFPPVQRVELLDLLVSVDVLTRPELVLDPGLLDPRRFGIVVRSGVRQGVLLPDLEGITSVDEQIQLARQKAGLRLEDAVELFRFEVVRYV